MGFLELLSQHLHDPHFIDLKLYMRAGDSLSIIHYKYLHEIRTNLQVAKNSHVEIQVKTS